MQLPISSTLLTAVREVMRARMPLARATLLPGAVVALSAVAVHLSTPGNPSDPLARVGHIWLLYMVRVAISSIAGILIAVSCHRIVLLGHHSLPASWGIYWSPRETTFLGRAFVIGLLTTIPPSLAGALLIVYMAHVRTMDWSLPGALSFAVSLPLAYPISRLSLVLPGTAIDDRVTFADSWRMTSGNGWRLALTLLTAPLLLKGLGTATRTLVPEGHAALVAVRAFLFCALGVFEIATLSVAFRTLRAQSRQL
jgi:hypothetical protein